MKKRIRMIKRINLLYFLCWCCLSWGLIIPANSETITTITTSPTNTNPILKPLLLFLLGVLGVMLGFLSSRRSSAILKGLCWLFISVISFIIVVSTYSFFCASKQFLKWGLGVAMAGLLVTLIVTLYKYSKYLPRSKNHIVWSMTLLIVVTIALTLWVPNMWGLNLPKLNLTDNLLEYYIGQLSLTFITISVMSVLSDKSVVIYWENVAEAKLIKPLFGNFASYTIYSITATVGAGISVILCNDLAFVVFFSINVFILILLTLTMVDVYYGREKKKAKLAKVLSVAYDERGLEISTIEFSIKDCLYYDPLSSRNPDNYLDIMQNLQYHLHQEIENHNIPYIREVAELYGSYVGCFDTAEGRQIKELLLSSGLDIVPIMVDGLFHRMSYLAQAHETTNVLIDSKWMEDRQLWRYFANKEKFDSIISTDTAKKNMTYMLIKRLQLLEDDVFNEKSLIKNSAFNSIKPLDSFEKTFQKFWETSVCNNPIALRFLSHLFHVVLLLGESSRKQLKLFSENSCIIHTITPYLKQLRFNDKDIRSWTKIFM